MSINCKVMLWFEKVRFSLIGDFFGPAISDQVENYITVRLASSGLTDCQKKALDVGFSWPQYLYCWGRPSMKT